MQTHPTKRRLPSARNGSYTRNHALKRKAGHADSKRPNRVWSVLVAAVMCIGLNALADKPNLVIIHTDEHNFRTLGCYRALMTEDQAYLELNRPALHVMRRLKAEGKLTDAEMTFFHDKKPEEELYDLVKDPDELHNLAGNPEFTKILEEMRDLENQWVAQHRDMGLEDLGKRHPEQGLGAVQAREGVKKNEPELWERLEKGELLPTSQWMKKYQSPK